MILHPSVIALILGSLLVSSMLMAASWFGVKILQRWDISSGSELQLNMERKTYLISTLVGYAVLFQLLSLFLFIYTADSLCTLFLGAMCAAGTLHVNGYGYPTLIFKIVNFILGGVWLIFNHVDSRGYDYPLIRHRYRLLIIMTPLIIMEGLLQAFYFLTMKPHIITSCCGKLFNISDETLAAGVAGLPIIPMEVVFFTAMVVTLGIGTYFMVRMKGGLLFAASSSATFVISAAAVISFISLYIYEMPTHHCPFCIIQKEYYWIGYIIYGALLSGVITGLGVGTTASFVGAKSLQGFLLPFQRKLVLTSLICYFLVLVIALYVMVFSDLVLMP